MSLQTFTTPGEAVPTYMPHAQRMEMLRTATNDDEAASIASRLLSAGADPYIIVIGLAAYVTGLNDGKPTTVRRLRWVLNAIAA